MKCSGKNNTIDSNHLNNEVIKRKQPVVILEDILLFRNRRNLSRADYALVRNAIATVDSTMRPHDSDSSLNSMSPYPLRSRRSVSVTSNSPTVLNSHTQQDAHGQLNKSPAKLLSGEEAAKTTTVTVQLNEELNSVLVEKILDHNKELQVADKNSTDLKIKSSSRSDLSISKSNSFVPHSGHKNLLVGHASTIPSEGSSKEPIELISTRSSETDRNILSGSNNCCICLDIPQENANSVFSTDAQKLAHVMRHYETENDDLINKERKTPIEYNSRIEKIFKRCFATNENESNSENRCSSPINSPRKQHQSPLNSPVPNNIYRQLSRQMSPKIVENEGAKDSEDHVLSAEPLVGIRCEDSKQNCPRKQKCVNEKEFGTRISTNSTRPFLSCPTPNTCKNESKTANINGGNGTGNLITEKPITAASMIAKSLIELSLSPSLSKNIGSHAVKVKLGIPHSTNSIQSVQSGPKDMNFVMRTRKYIDSRRIPISKGKRLLSSADKKRNAFNSQMHGRKTPEKCKTTSQLRSRSSSRVKFRTSYADMDYDSTKRRKRSSSTPSTNKYKSESINRREETTSIRQLKHKIVAQNFTTSTAKKRASELLRNMKKASPRKKVENHVSKFAIKCRLCSKFATSRNQAYFHAVYHHYTHPQLECSICPFSAKITQETIVKDHIHEKHSDRTDAVMTNCISEQSEKAQTFVEEIFPNCSKVFDQEARKSLNVAEKTNSTNPRYDRGAEHQSDTSEDDSPIAVTDIDPQPLTVSKIGKTDQSVITTSTSKIRNANAPEKFGCKICTQLCEENGIERHIIEAHINKPLVLCPCCPFSDICSMHTVRQHILKRHPKYADADPVDCRPGMAKAIKELMAIAFPPRKPSASDNSSAATQENRKKSTNSRDENEDVTFPEVTKGADNFISNTSYACTSTGGLEGSPEQPSTSSPLKRHSDFYTHSSNPISPKQMKTEPHLSHSFNNLGIPEMVPAISVNEVKIPMPTESQSRQPYRTGPCRRWSKYYENCQTMPPIPNWVLQKSVEHKAENQMCSVKYRSSSFMESIKRHYLSAGLEYANCQIPSCSSKLKVSHNSMREHLYRHASGPLFLCPARISGYCLYAGSENGNEIVKHIRDKHPHLNPHNYWDARAVYDDELISIAQVAFPGVLNMPTG